MFCTVSVAEKPMKHISYSWMLFIFSSDFCTFVVLCFLDTWSRWTLSWTSLWSYDPLSHTCATEPLDLWHLRHLAEAWLCCPEINHCRVFKTQIHRFWIVEHIYNIFKLCFGYLETSQVCKLEHRTFGNGDICDRAINSYFSYIGKRVMMSRSAQGYNTPGDAPM